MILEDFLLRPHWEDRIGARRGATRLLHRLAADGLLRGRDSPRGGSWRRAVAGVLGLDFCRCLALGPAHGRLGQHVERSGICGRHAARRTRPLGARPWLVAISFLPGIRLDLLAYLFGDIRSVTWNDLGVIWIGSGLVVALLAFRWRALLLTTLNPELAFASGINPKRERLVLTIALALVVAVAIKVVGALLIAAMLIIPAATARPVASTPERMALIATGLGILAVSQRTDGIVHARYTNRSDDRLGCGDLLPSR